MARKADKTKRIESNEDLRVALANLYARLEITQAEVRLLRAVAATCLRLAVNTDHTPERRLKGISEALASALEAADGAQESTG